MLTSLFSLAKKDLVADPLRPILGVITIFFCVLLGTLLLSFMQGLENIAVQQARADYHDNEVKVTPKYSVGFFRVTKEEQTKLTADILASLLKVPHVLSLRKEGLAQFPSSLEVALFNTKFETDSPLYGIDDAEFQRIQGAFQAKADHVPVLISKQLVDIYNIGIAQAIHQPLLNEDFLKGRTFDLKLGYSSFFKTGGTIQSLTAEIVGIADEVPVVGLSLPLSRIEAMNTTMLGESFTPYYSKAYVTVDASHNIAEVQSAIKNLGFDAYSIFDETAPVQSKLAYVEYIIYGLLGSIFLLMTVFIFFLFVTQFREKRYLIALLKTIGAARSHIVKFFMMQMSFMLMIGFILGTAVGNILLYFGNKTLAEMFPTLLTKDLQFLPLSFPVALFLFLVAGFLCFAATLIPAVQALHLSPRQVLADH